MEKKIMIFSRFFPKTELSNENFEKYLAYKKERNAQIVSLVKISLGFLTGAGLVALGYFIANVYLTCLVGIVFGAIFVIISVKDFGFKTLGLCLWGVSFFSIFALGGYYYGNNSLIIIGMIVDVIIGLWFLSLILFKFSMSAILDE